MVRLHIDRDVMDCHGPYIPFFDVFLVHFLFIDSIIDFISCYFFRTFSLKVVKEYERVVIFRLGRLLPGGKPA